jgi:hypothetical protein
VTTTTKFAYDKSHRLTTQYIAGGEAHYYTYNQRNMVTNITDFKPLGGSEIPRSFAYNGLGERVLTKDDPGSLGDPTLFAYWSYDGRRLLQDNECQQISPLTFVATNYRSHQTPNDCPFGWVDEVITELADTPVDDEQEPLDLDAKFDDENPLKNGCRDRRRRTADLDDENPLEAAASSAAKIRCESANSPRRLAA